MSELREEMTAAEFVIERMKADPKIAAVVADAHLFDDLQQNPGWRRLFEKVVADKARVTNELADRLMRGDIPTAEEVSFYRGYYQGAVFVLQHPAVAEENLERAAKKAWALVQLGLEQIEEEESPYITG